MSNKWILVNSGKVLRQDMKNCFSSVLQNLDVHQGKENKNCLDSHEKRQDSWARKQVRVKKLVELSLLLVDESIC